MQNEERLKTMFRTISEDEKVRFPWLEERTILLAPTGSTVYGTNIEEVSDDDYIGICIPPKSYYLGLNSFNEYSNTNGKNFRNKKGDIDLVIQHINKFIKNAIQGVPNNIEILFLNPDQYVILTSLGKVLIDNRKLFLTKLIKDKYDNFADAQIKKLKTKKLRSTGRIELIEKYGYDTKFFSHAVRLLTSAIEILETGDYVALRPNREFLKECRLGKYTLEETFKIVDDLRRKLNDAYLKSKLPEEPDYEAINNLLIEINERALSGEI